MSRDRVEVLLRKRVKTCRCSTGKRSVVCSSIFDYCVALTLTTDAVLSGKFRGNFQKEQILENVESDEPGAVQAIRVFRL
jgi:hypothetical protein